MIKHIHTKICPLCSKKLKNLFNGKTDKYYCSEFYFRGQYDWDELIYLGKPTKESGYKVKQPHYSVVYEDGNFTQSTILPPYWIRTKSDTGKSKIYKFPFKPGVPESNLIMDVAIIEPSDYTPERLTKKIKNLLIFL